MYRRKFMRRPRRKILRRRGLGRKRVSKVVKKYVKKAIHRTIENKEIIEYGANQSITAGTVSTQSKALLFSISQGTGENARIGNQVKITKMTFNVEFNLKPYNSTYNPWAAPFWVKVWIIKDLQTSGQQASLPNLSKFFRGNGGTLGFQNNVLDTLLPVNKDWFRVLTTRTFKLGSSNHVSGATNSSSYFDNSPFAKKLTFNLAKYVRQQLKFDDSNTNNLPINANLYMVCQAVPCDGSSISDAQSLVEYHYVHDINFEDA